MSPLLLRALNSARGYHGARIRSLQGRLNLLAKERFYVYVFHGRMAHAKQRPQLSEETVVTKAVQRIASALGLTQRELGQVLGISEATVSRLGRQTQLGSERKEFELALLLVRLFRSLDALVGGDEEKAKRWLRAPNRYFDEVPATVIKKVEGLLHVVEYLDAMRGPI
jgi:transcriptional regulator with XRE-family HTH domain